MKNKAKTGAKKAGQVVKRTIGDMSDEILEIPKNIPQQALGLPEKSVTDNLPNLENPVKKTIEEKSFLQQLLEVTGVKEKKPQANQSSVSENGNTSRKLTYLDTELAKLKKEAELQKEQARLIDEQQKAAPVPEKALQVPSSRPSRRMGAGTRQQKAKQGTRESGDVRRSG